jgi:N utilization substance protein A
MPPEEQVERERYNIGNRLKFYLKSVDMGIKGSMLVVSRTAVELIKAIFEEEIPEIASGAIEIKSIAREAGSRTKVAIMSHEENIDPIGSCVGQRGSRIQTIISELSGEKVDIILWDDDPAKFITNALSPAKVTNVNIDEANRLAKVTVKEDQLSLAIGRGGQNVRLASRLTGWKIDITADIKNANETAAPTAENENTEVAKVKDDVEEKKESQEAEEKPAKDKKKKKVKEIVEEATEAPAELTEETVEETPSDISE